MPALRALVGTGHPPALVITPPEKRRGRGATATRCPVGAAAEVLGIPVHATADVNDAKSVGALHARRPDLLVVVAFGQILKKEVLALPRLGALNLHFSVLPRWRGAAPVQRAIEAGDAVTGVSVQRIVAKLDAGPVIGKRELEIGPEERAGELEARLADIGAALLADVVAHAGDTGTLIAGKPQDDALVTLAPKVGKDDAAPDFRATPAEFVRRVRAFHPWPLVQGSLASASRKGPQAVAIHRARVGTAKRKGTKAAPGVVLAAGRDGIEVACGAGTVLLTELQRPGAKVLGAAAFLNGFPVKAGDRFSAPR